MLNVTDYDIHNTKLEVRKIVQYLSWLPCTQLTSAEFLELHMELQAPQIVLPEYLTITAPKPKPKNQKPKIKSPPMKK